jgi:hypothetical protein
MLTRCQRKVKAPPKKKVRTAKTPKKPKAKKPFPFLDLPAVSLRAAPSQTLLSTNFSRNRSFVMKFTICA